jgi:hypothetical protein
VHHSPEAGRRIPAEARLAKVAYKACDARSMFHWAHIPEEHRSLAGHHIQAPGVSGSSRLYGRRKDQWRP